MTRPAPISPLFPYTTLFRSWLFLNRTRVGMMIRAGVDDRAMLAASGINVNLVFAITFAIGAGLAGFGGVIGAVELSMVPGRSEEHTLNSSHLGISYAVFCLK